MAALSLIWGLNFGVVKNAFSAIDPLAFNALRFPVAAVVVWGLLRGAGAVGPVRKKDVVALVALGILGNVVYQVLFIVGLDLTLAGNAGILLATIPVWTTLLSTAVGHERPSPRFWAGVAGTLLGAGLVVGGGAAGSGLGLDTLRGDLMVLAAAACWTVYTVGSRPLMLRYGSLPVTAWTLWVGTVGTVLVGLPALSATDFGALPPSAWLAIGYAGAFALGVAYVLWNRGVRVLGSARTAVYGNLVPVVALVGAWAIVRERPTPAQIAGVFVVLLGVTLARSEGGAVRAPAAASSPGTRRR